MTDLFKFVREWADFDKNTEYLFGCLHPTVSCCIPDRAVNETKKPKRQTKQNERSLKKAKRTSNSQNERFGMLFKIERI